MSVTLPGGCWTLNFSEYPNGAKESFLSQILESPESVAQRFYLSARACRGILNRAAKRGKNLPEALKKALEMQCACECGGGL